MKTSELTGAALNWAVAQCLELKVTFDSWGVCYIGKVQRDESGLGYPAPFEPSDNWAQGGPIIEREGLLVRPSFTDERGKWTSILWASTSFFESGPTPLIAAMRCYVASKLGDEIEIPEELK